MAGKTVLAIGIDLTFADFSGHPQLSAELVRSYIDAELQRLRAQGYDVTFCLIDLDQTAEQVRSAALGAKNSDCVVIGAGLRVPPERCSCSRKFSTTSAGWRCVPASASTPIRPTPSMRCSAGCSHDPARGRA
jgi:hypothetical protein